MQRRIQKEETKKNGDPWKFRNMLAKNNKKKFKQNNHSER